jgi:predicted enzyme related to lactoylglutathione lyase
VADCDASTTKVSALGGSVVVPPMDSPPGRFALVSDPFGVSFGIIALAS